MFAGLISPAAENLYDRLRDAGQMTADEFGSNGEPADQLLAAGLAFPSGNGQARVCPVERATALQLLLAEEHRKLAATHTRLLTGWNRLATMLPAVVEQAGDEITGINSLTMPDKLASCIADLYCSARRKLRVAENGEFPNRPAFDRSLPVVEYQLIYQSTCIDNATHAELSTAQIKVRGHVPVTMLLADDTIAIISSRGTSLLVRAPVILTMLADWFDLMWTARDSADFPTASPTLTQLARRILTMMIFDDDESIARKLNLSVSTVRRHIKAIYLTLGVNNRFAAGTTAAKLGLV